MNPHAGILLTVIVPIYNVENYVEKCIDSIVNQKIGNMELLLIDDGSTDESGQIIDKMALTYDCITVVHKENHGVNSARNAGLAIAKGKYITMVDGDDYILPDTFAMALDYMETHQTVDILQYPEIIMDIQYGEDGKWRPGYPQEIVQLDDCHEKIGALIGRDALFPGELWGKIYRRRIWDNLRLREDMQYCEDAYIFPYIMEHCRSIVLSPRGGYCYILRAGSATQTESTPKKRLDCFRFKAVFYETSLKYQINSGFWWNEACFAAIDAWTFYGPCEEIRRFLKRLRQTRQQVKWVRSPKKLAIVAWLFTPLFVANINRLRRQILN